MTETISEIALYDLPYGRKAELRNIQFEGGMNMLRLVLREGKRITQVDLDGNVASSIAADMQSWAKEQS